MTPPAPRFQSRELLELGVCLEAAPQQRRAQDVHLFAEQTWIDHKLLIVYAAAFR